MNNKKIEQLVAMGINVERIDRDNDPDRTDLYLCRNCSIAMESISTHLWQGLDEQQEQDHGPDFIKGVPMSAQIDLFMYEVRITATKDIPTFIKKRRFEDMLNLRDPKMFLLSTKQETCTIDYLAKRSDGTDNPLFPEQILQWLVELRETHEFPNETLPIPYFKYGVTLEDSLLMGEVFLFCIWMNEQIIGSGSQLFSGRIVPDFPATEEELERDGWGEKPYE